MKENVAKFNKKNVIFKSIRVKQSTKDKCQNFLIKLNKNKNSGKVTFDALVNFFLDNVDKADIEKLQLSTLTWDIEGERIRHLYQTKFGELSNSLWTQFIQTDLYREFAKEHSRLPLPWEQSAQMFQLNGRKKSKSKIKPLTFEEGL